VTLFVTGAESFIGRALAAQCEKLGLALTGVDSAVPANSATQRADIRDPSIADLIPEGATVIHLAAISRDPDCRADPRTAFEVNVGGTLNLGIAAQHRRARQFVFASSEWVYGDVRNDEVQLEDRPIDVTAIKSEYALTKIVAEQCLKLSCQLPATTVLRFGIVYGPRAGNWSAVESLLNSVLTQDEIKVGALKTARCFVHVDDIATGILASLGRQKFEIFNLSGDRPVSLEEIIDASARLIGRRPKVVETNPSQPSVRNPNNSKARVQLGWKPALDLETGLKTVVEFLAQTFR
jgi:nucleoside-diphosphate-sugar epimerase